MTFSEEMKATCCISYAQIARLDNHFTRGNWGGMSPAVSSYFAYKKYETVGNARLLPAYCSAFFLNILHSDGVTGGFEPAHYISVTLAVCQNAIILQKQEWNRINIRILNYVFFKYEVCFETYFYNYEYIYGTHVVCFFCFASEVECFRYSYNEK